MASARRSVAMVVYNDLIHDARVHKEACTLRDAGYEAHVIGMCLDDTPPLTGWEGIAVTRLHVGSSGSLRVRYARFWRRVERLLRVLGPDAIHAHDVDVLAPCWLAARRLDVPLVHDAHELWTELPSLVGRPIIRGIWAAIAGALVPRCDAVITVADGIADELRRRHRVNPRVVRNCPVRRPPAEPAPLRRQVGVGAEAPLLIYQGGLLPGAGVDRAIDLMDYLPEAHLVIIGDGPLRAQIAGHAADAPARDRITLLPAVPFNDLPPITAAADVGLLLGESAGMNLRLALPNKLFEYIAAGIPVVATDWPEVGRVVRRYDVGRLVPAGRLWSRWPRRYRSALAERPDLAEHARRAADDLVWDREAPQLVECYDCLPWRSRRAAEA